ncbi:hypothetical protein F4560_004896 [Saccharothrix ecbatanensis]|uniref:Uncharacterized protein n=1 Tax=Saccharothrix ecbatanensis TaxID=1105145 RepID=A0A7W9HMP5_9PSEU|nr:hypothetical protein [Saccharothrix ecbatanensis]MBB5805128.1 hypothetical protein [Saccharothrix ecbatanensis]
MGKNGRRKRRQRSTQQERDNIAVIAATRFPQPAVRTKPKNWFDRQSGGVQTFIVVAATAWLIGGHLIMWDLVFPTLGKVVGRVPVVSTVTGWLFVGGAFIAWAVVAFNRGTAKPGTANRLKGVAWVWSAVAVVCVPTYYADGVSLPVDFWAGVYSGGYGVFAAPPALGVAALGWWLVSGVVLKRKGRPTNQTVGWICVAYATLLLVLGSTLLRV